MRPLLTAISAVLLGHAIFGSFPAHAQMRISYRGLVEIGLTGYPQSAPNDPTQGIADVLARFEPSIDITQGVSLAASFDARMDTHDEVGRRWDVDYWDRSITRPALAVRRLVLTLTRGPLTLELGKQFVRWGQVDIISPTDRFTARDYMLPLAAETLATTAARFTLTGRGHTFELVAAPRLVPSRMPLLSHRWIGVPAAGFDLVDGGAVYPGGGQYGVRYNRISPGVEYAVSFFQGYNPLPRLAVAPLGPATASITRHYPAVRAYGAEAMVPLRGVALKAEAAWIESYRRDTDDYGLYVVQAERQQGEWLFIGGYVGEFVTADRGAITYAPDRGLAGSLVGRASFTIDTNSSVTLESVIRQDGAGWYARAEYSRAAGSHWRVTLRATVIRGSLDDYLGQYRRNSYGATQVRFSY
jgi:hypothetical protein